jgi:hypothetical protein
MDSKPRVFQMSFASVYPLYVQKATRKGRTQAEVDEIIAWLTGYRGAQLRRALDAKVDLETFFARAPRMNPNVGLITGLVCGVRVEDVADPLMRQIRYLDKLIDELARGKAMSSILRTAPSPAAAPARAAARPAPRVARAARPKRKAATGRSTASKRAR